jgi:hypothetical protein
MASINIQAMDDFMATNIAKYQRVEWQDISLQLQEFFFAQKLFGKAKPDEMNGSQVVWDVQYDYDDNFAVTAPYDPDVSSRRDTMTQAKMFWSFMKANYQYDYREDIFNQKPEAIVRWLDVKEHGLDNSFFAGMEKLMFGPGPSSPTQQKPPPASLQWWLPAYNTATGQANANTALQLGTGVLSDFVGGDPAGFSSVGTGGISSLTYPGWRHRVGQYTAFSEDDAVDTILECMDKCDFTPAKSYPQLASETDPRWDLLTTYSRLKLARKIAASQNDNLRGELGKWKDTVTIRGVPMRWVPAWTNQSFGTARTDGPIMGVDWKAVKAWSKSSLNMTKSPPERDKDNHLGRWRFLDHSMQITFSTRRTSFHVNYGGTGTITESN